MTTPKKLVIIDTKNRKFIDAVDLSGTLQGCDIAPDFSVLAIAPISAQFIYRVPLDWKKIEDLEVSQVRFKADSTETGVHGICVGFDKSIIFSMRYAGSGPVKLRRLGADDKVGVLREIAMDSVLTSSGERRYAAVAAGNTSEGPLLVYDFKERSLSPVTNLNDILYEIGCGREARHFARPHRKGCDIIGKDGGRIGNLAGAPVICAAFHPTSDTLFVLRHGEVNVQEYDAATSKLLNAYPLDKPLVIKKDVIVTTVVDLLPVGPDAVTATFRKIVQFNFRTFESGRLRVADNGRSLFAVVSSGVYMFPIQDRTGTKKAGPKIKVIDGDD